MSGGWFTTKLQRRAALAVVASLVAPWAVGAFFKGFHQPGLVNDATHSQLLIDYIVIGATLFGLTMVATWLIGCWVVAVLRGPRREADAFPGATGAPPP